ncbi:hypothetical protein BT96DRAFT_1008080 [Gymnopus androsaceus JB14]|uniref:Uncharacterized protein n=1 Tax=Gymnopus androsaceus JB14 TaxID=1447944 RepID=A0A6A4GFS2_9AGAR|nr:hypothetical protein BT96DRAFT_1008080 [Gymnopus androsaceus JB14]
MHRSQSSGRFRGTLIAKTFAFHLTWALSSCTNSGYPCGALALSTAAVERALTICQTGEPPKRKTARNSDESFSEERAPNVAKFFRLAEELKPAKWDEVCSAAEIHLLTIPKAGAGPELKKLLKEASGKNPVAAATEVVEDDPFVVSD